MYIPESYIKPVCPRGSKYPIFKDSGPKSHEGVWLLEPESLGYLDPLGVGCWQFGCMVLADQKGPSLYGTYISPEVMIW